MWKAKPLQKSVSKNKKARKGNSTEKEINTQNAARVAGTIKMARMMGTKMQKL